MTKPDSTLQKFRASGGDILWVDRTADNIHTLNSSSQATWYNQVVNVPETALLVHCNAHWTIPGAQGMVAWGSDEATGAVTGGARLISTMGAGGDFALHGFGWGASGDFFFAGMSFDLPITTPATPTIAYAVTVGLLSAPELAISGYYDRWAPRGF